MLGNPGNIDEILKIAEENSLFLTEDCVKAFGASYKGKSVGTYGKVGAFSLNVYKTITAGDDGMILTDNNELYERAFAIHDQGHLPLRKGVEQGKRTILGLNFRMNELTATVASVQLKKVDLIKEKLHYNKQILKHSLAGINEIEFRKIWDEKGDFSTLLTFYMTTEESAEKLTKRLGCTTISGSGWHVYSNMEHLLGKMTVTNEKCPFLCPFYDKPEVIYEKGMLPQTDGLLKRGINISVGVSDPGLGSAYGITINDTKEQIKLIVENLKKAIRNSL